MVTILHSGGRSSVGCVHRGWGAGAALEFCLPQLLVPHLPSDFRDGTVFSACTESVLKKKQSGKMKVRNNRTYLTDDIENKRSAPLTEPSVVTAVSSRSLLAPEASL